MSLKIHWATGINGNSRWRLRRVTAIGIYNQFVFVDPSRVVIFKLSANRAYGTWSDEATNSEDETIEFLCAIAREFD